MKKSTKILAGAFLAVTGVAVATSAALSILSRKYIDLAVKRGTKKYNNDKQKAASFKKKTPQEIETLMSNYEKAEERAGKWVATTHMEKQTITSDDGLSLYGELYKQPYGSKNYVIIVHGYNCNLEMMYPYGPVFSDLGYNVLFIDMRSHGKSEGDYIGMGWLERMDIKKWCEHIAKRDPYSNIVLFGQSMGAASVLMACGEDLPANVKACIEDSGYTSVSDIFNKTIANVIKFKVTIKPIMNIANRQLEKVAKYSIYDGDTIGQVKKSHTPTLFIHCTEDSYVPCYMQKELYDALNAPKEIYTCEGGEHVLAYFKDPDKYVSVVKSFLDKYVK